MSRTSASVWGANLIGAEVYEKNPECPLSSRTCLAGDSAGAYTRTMAASPSRWIVAVVTLVALVPACDRGGTRAEPTGTTASPASPTRPTGEPTAGPGGPRLATGEALPETCPAAPATTAATVAFVANGRAWALAPDGTGLACLFDVADPGPFAWGPLGDRVVLANLEIRGLDGAPSRDVQELAPPAFSWGRPTGKSVVFIRADGSRLEKIHLGRTAVEDITPIPNVRYLNVVYHPSGLALAFVVKRRQESLWLSSNVGLEPKRVVFTEVGTTFGAMDFTVNGKRLLYAAQHNDDHADLHTIDLTDTSTAPVLWSGPVGEHILEIHAGPGASTAAFTAGTSCGDSAAMARTPNRPRGLELLPGKERPTRAVGWLGGQEVLVAAGDCDGPFDLFAVDVASGSATPLVVDVAAASVRTPAPTPPPPLPESVPDEGGFA